jgi:CBS domain-containing protein
MARYRSDLDDDREYSARNERVERERPGNYNDPNRGRAAMLDAYGDRGSTSGRFGERANYEYNEPRYNDYRERRGRDDSGSYGDWEGSHRTRSADVRTGYESRPRYSDRTSRSRLRVRDIMTRELAVATRNTTLREVSLMMKEEDTGVIPVVDYSSNGGNGKAAADERRSNTSSYSHGKLVGLITDRDIVVRAVADGKDCNVTGAEEVMSTDVYTARPHDRVVDVIRKMGDKQVRRIPVVSESGNLRGMVSMGDIAVETEADRELAEALEDISRESSFWGKLFG